MKVVPLVERSNNAKSADITATLQDALHDLDTGARVATHCAIIFVDRADSAYKIGFQQCGMSMSELVALLEIAKQQIIHNEMK